jgi:hypothetical protein
LISQRDESRSFRATYALEQDSTIIAAIEMSQSEWLVAAVVPGVERQPLKKLDADEAALLKHWHRWRNEVRQTGRAIKRIAANAFSVVGASRDSHTK